MKVIVLSLGLGCLAKELKKGTKIIFIPNAGDPYEDPYFVKDDFKRLLQLGFDVKELNLSSISKPFKEVLTPDIGALFVAGGNTFYLLAILRDTGFDVEIKNWIESGRVYVGASAGGVVLGPSIEPIVTLDDPAKAPTLTSFQSLGLINTIVLPHYGKEKYLQRYQAIIDQFQSKYSLQKLKDNEALYFTTADDFKKINSELVFHS